MTTGKRFTDRTKDHSEQRVLDARTRAVLNSVASLPKGARVVKRIVPEGAAAAPPAAPKTEP